MSQKIIESRIRPQAIAIVIDRNASEEQFLLCIRLMSQLWGGKHFKIYVVDGNDEKQKAVPSLAALRPEFVYGVGIDDYYWREKLAAICQPRGFGILTEHFVSRIGESHAEDFYLIHHVLLQVLREKQDKMSDRYRKIMTVECTTENKLSTFVTAFFGSAPASIKPPLFDGSHYFEGASFDAFLDLAATFQEKNWLSLLNLTRFKLRIAPAMLHLPPTIVLVESWHDLALYWNLQSMEGHNHPGWIMPIPASEKLLPSSIEKLARWFERSGNDELQSNYWHVTSSTVSKEACEEFAASLQQELAETTVGIVEYKPQSDETHLAIPYEYKTRIPVERNGRKLIFQMPSSKALSEVNNHRAVMIDLLSDVSTGRSPMEMQLPPSQVVFQLLNCPSPPTYSCASTAVVGDGPESVSVRCTEPDSIFELYCPTAFEIIDETMRFSGFEGVHDEKRSLYSPIIRMFGGIDQAASDMSATCGRVLRFLCTNPSSVTAIKGHIQIGGSDVEPIPYLTRIENILQQSSDIVRRVGLNRFKRYARGKRPSEKKLEEILEYWVERGVLRRTIKIGPCKHCRREFYAERITLVESVACHFCGKTTSIRSQVVLSYALDPRVVLAINEGIIPVVQTARFLSNLTFKGFMYLPGYKFKSKDEIIGDVDLIAICDGHLVFCECKDLEDSSIKLTSCSDIMNQFRKTIENAIRNGASVAVFASRLIEYPEQLQNCLEAEFGNRIAIRLLNQSDLDNGFRQIGSALKRMNIYDLVSKPKDQILTPQSPAGRRVIRSKWFVQSD